MHPRTQLASNCYAALVTGEDAQQPAADLGADPGACAERGVCAGVLDLLGLMAYAQLVAFFRLSDDAALAASLEDKAALAQMAVAEFGHFQLLRRRIEELGAAPGEVMAPFVAAVDAFHARTAPADWLESLVKAYVGDGIAADFYRTVATLLDAPTQTLVLEVLADTGHSAFVIERVRAAIARRPAGRRAAGAVGASPGGRGVRPGAAGRRRAGVARPACWPTARGASSATSGRMFARLTDAHAERMTALGLSE